MQQQTNGQIGVVIIIIYNRRFIKIISKIKNITLVRTVERVRRT